MRARNNDENTGLTVEILSITIDSNVTACLNGKPVTIPNWEQEIDVIDGNGSKRPGVFDMTAPKRYRNLNLRLKVKGLKNKKKAILTGKLADLTFTTKITGDHTTEIAGKDVIAQAFSQKIPGHFKHALGEMDWFLDNDINPFQTTRLEMYWIYGPPGIMYKKGVWVEVLRLLASICIRLTDKKKIIQRIVNYCHASTPLQYDSDGGFCGYAEAYWGGCFNLEAFLKQADPRCNCFDQAGALQTLAGALGIELTWINMRPFGFINRACLIGRGETNNPFFLENESPEIVGRNDHKRSGFGEHSFCLWKKNNESEVVLDSCLGPILADVPIGRYLKRNIDSKTNLYKYRRSRPGTSQDIRKCSGIKDVHALNCTEVECKKFETKDKRKTEDKRIKEFKKKINFDSIGVKSGKNAIMDVHCKWKNPLSCPELKNQGWKIKFQCLLSGSDTAAKEWILVRGNEHLKIKIFVSNQGINEAKKRLLTIAQSTAMPEIPFELKTEPALGNLHVAYHKIAIWCFHNVCFLVDGSNSSIALHPVTSWLQEQAEKSVVRNLPTRPLVSKDGIPMGVVVIKVDQEKTISVSPDGKYNEKFLMIEPFFSTEFLRLIKEEPFSLTFKGISAGKTDIRLVLINKQTLLCSTLKSIRVEIQK